MLQTKVLVKIKTSLMISNFFSENCAFLKCLEKHGMCRQAVDDNIMLRRNYVICMQGN
jgi:hypothetical protein